jgi:SulP family sulfate permease
MTHLSPSPPNQTPTATFIQRARFYISTDLKADLPAGLAVAMVAIPQGMAYAQLAGLPPVLGLYTVILPAMIAALFGSSAFLITGATNAMALALANALAPFANSPNFVEYAFVLAILSGALRLAFGLLRLGSLIHYVSNSVLTGLLSAVGVSIILNQLAPLLGLPRSVGSDATAVIMSLVGALNRTNFYVLAVGVSAMLIVWGFRRFSRRLGFILPGPLTAVVCTAGMVALLGWDRMGVGRISDLAEIGPAGLYFHIPAISPVGIPDLFSSTLALSIVGMIEALNLSRAVGRLSNERINPSRELIGQGLASLIGGFFQCFPASGSAARTALNHNAGARTRMAALFSGGFAWLAMAFFFPWVGYIPNAGLAGVLIVSAAGIFNKQDILLTWHSGKVSRTILLTTFLSALLLPFHYAVYIGVILSIVIYLVQSSQIKMHFLTRSANGRYEEHPIEQPVFILPGTILLNLEGPLFFGATDYLEGKISLLLRPDVKVMILRLRRLHHIGSSGIKTLDGLVKMANAKGVRILLCGIQPDDHHAIRSSGLADRVGPENIFPASRTLLDSTDQAVIAAARLQQLE